MTYTDLANGQWLDMSNQDPDDFMFNAPHLQTAVEQQFNPPSAYRQQAGSTAATNNATFLQSSPQVGFSPQGQQQFGSNQALYQPSLSQQMGTMPNGQQPFGHRHLNYDMQQVFNSNQTAYRPTYNQPVNVPHNWYHGNGQQRDFGSQVSNMPYPVQMPFGQPTRNHQPVTQHQPWNLQHPVQPSVHQHQMSRLPQVQQQLAPQQVPLGRKQQHADLALEIRRQLTPQQVNKIHNDFRRMPPQQQAPLLDRGLDPVMFSCYNQATNILEQRSTLQMATVPQLMPAIVPAQQPVTTTQPAVGTQDFPISVDDEEDQRRAALPRNAFPKQDAPPAQEVPPRQEAFPVQEEFPTQEELPFDDPFRDPYMFEELFPEFSFDERTASAQETSPTPENAIIQEASPLQQTTTLPTPPATTATTTATTTPAPQPAASSKPKALDITSRVYAESDRPCEGDVAYPAFCTMNWMNMHSEHFRFNKVAKSHRFYVLDSANADGQSWYCISVLDGSKMYHWELNAQLEALDKAKAEAEAQRLAGRKKRGEANEKKNGCKRKASEPTPASNDNGDEKEGSERKRIKMEGGESMDPLLNFSREPAAVPSTDMAMAEATPLEHQTGNDDEAGLARVGSVQLEDTTNEDDDQREEADNYECQLDIDMNPVAQSGPRPQVSDLFAFLFEPEELTEEADHTEDQTEGSQAEEEPKHEPMVQPVQQQVEQSDEQPEERWVGQSDEQPEKQPEDDLEDEFDRAIKEAMESVEKGDAAEEDAAAEGIDGPEGEPVCDSHSESEWSEEE